jgi:hypothetical protein
MQAILIVPEVQASLHQGALPIGGLANCGAVRAGGL